MNEGKSKLYSAILNINKREKRDREATKGI